MKYEPELGQAVFGQPHKEYGVSTLCESALRMISDLWANVMWNKHQKELPSPFANTGAKWNCDVFEVEAYNWNEETEQTYNFKWKDVEISWYKYLGRGMSCNQILSNDKIAKMLNDCLGALNENR